MMMPTCKEGRLHSSAKLQLASALKHLEGPVYIQHETPRGWQTIRVDLTGLRPVVECAYPSGERIDDANAYFAMHGHYPEMIFDVAMVNEAGKPLFALEVVKGSWIDERKRAKLMRSPVIAVGVHAKLHEWYVDIHRLDARQLVVPNDHALDIETYVVGQWRKTRAN